MDQEPRRGAPVSAGALAEAEYGEGEVTDRLFRLLVETVREYAIFMIAPDGRIASWNHGAERMGGYSADEVLGRPLAMLYTEEDRERGWPDEVLRRAAEEGRHVAEGWRERKGGDRFWARVALTAIRDDDGRVLGFGNVTQDLTSDRELKRAIEDTAERFRFLFENNPTLYFIVDPEGTILSVNRYGAEHLGYSAPELVGRPLLEIVHEDDREAVLSSLTECARDPGQVCRWDFRKVRRDGRVLWVREMVRPMENARGELVILIVCDDVTEIKALEQERERLFQREQQARAEAQRQRQELERITESRTHLMRGFSHDVKNPLGAADGYAALLEDGILGELSEEQEDSVRRIRRSIDTSLRLIHDLLDLARAEAGQIRLECVPTDVAGVVREMVADSGARAESAGLALNVEIPESMPAETDAARLRQVLENLLSNAVKYTEQGTVTVSAEKATDEAGEWIEIHVSDTGPGIPQAEQERVFQEFSRLDGTSKEGAGVGLAISRRIARLLGGGITLRSEVGRGSTFTLRIPTRPPRPALD